MNNGAGFLAMKTTLDSNSADIANLKVSSTILTSEMNVLKPKVATLESDSSDNKLVLDTTSTGLASLTSDFNPVKDKVDVWNSYLTSSAQN